jgi:hypothetical protein
VRAVEGGKRIGLQTLLWGVLKEMLASETGPAKKKRQLKESV